MFREKILPIFVIHVPSGSKKYIKSRRFVDDMCTRDSTWMSKIMIWKRPLLNVCQNAQHLSL